MVKKKYFGKLTSTDISVICWAFRYESTQYANSQTRECRQAAKGKSLLI